MQPVCNSLACVAWGKQVVLDMGLSVDCIYMDFQTAFDTVPHRRLSGKLKSYNINEDIIGWIENFITGRTQQVVIGEECSGWMPVTSGIPQGSVLGPMLFVIYINDLLETVRSDVYLFAGDTKICKVLNSDNDKDILQSDLTDLTDWSEKWLLSFHPDKCKHIHITRERGDPTDHRYYLIQGKDLEVIESEKDIGVHIDQNINFDKHISAISYKANAMFAMLRKAFQYIDKETFIPLSKALIRTHLDYASSVYSPYKLKHVDQLEAVQRRATKQLPDVKDKSYPDRLKELKLPTLSYRRLRGDIIEVHKT